MNKRTKIIATIGPASEDKETLRKMIGAGMNVARLNFSHGTYENHKLLYENIRAVSRELGIPVGIHQDLQGPKIRVGELPDEGIELKKGTDVTFSTALEKYSGPGSLDRGRGQAKSGTGSEIPMTYKDLHKDVHKGDSVLLDDGLMEVKVKKVEGQEILTKVVRGGTLKSHKAFNVPGVQLSAPALSEKDIEDLKFGLDLGVDWVWLSFVKSSKDVQQLGELIEKNFKGEVAPKIMAKIEKKEAVNDLDNILELADGLVVARGDLAIEMDQAKVPEVQKLIIDKCRLAAKPVVVATQMLESMTKNPRPTRAELSDVAHAVFDHTDCTMLSGETTTGKYPVEVVRTMASIIHEAEQSPYDDVREELHIPKKALEHSRREPGHFMAAASAVKLAREIEARAIVVATRSGFTSEMVSAHRLEVPIIALTSHKKIRDQLTCSWGVEPFLIDEKKLESLNDKKIEKFASKLDSDIFPKGEGKIVFLNGYSTDKDIPSSLIHAI